MSRPTPECFWRGAGWYNVPNANLSGGSQAKINSGGSADFAFTGTAVDLLALKASTYGIAKITLDGGTPRPVDLYAPANAVQWKAKVWSATGLSENTTHTVRVEWTGTKNPAATDTAISIDAIDLIGGLCEYPLTRHEQADPLITYSGSWNSVAHTSLSSGDHAKLNATGSADISFKGPRVDLLALKASTYGIAKITLDGGTPQTVDLYAPANAVQWKAKVWSATGLSENTTHTVRVEWTGTKNPAATDTAISIDAIDLIGGLVQAPIVPIGPAKTRFEQDNPLAAYQGSWYNVPNANLSGGSQAKINSGGSADFAFTGTAVDLLALKASTYGIAKITLDGGTRRPSTCTHLPTPCNGRLRSGAPQGSARTPRTRFGWSGPVRRTRPPPTRR